MNIRRYANKKVAGKVEIPILLGPPAKYVVIYSIELLDLLSGEFLMVTAQCEVGNETSKCVMISAQLVLSDAATEKLKEDLIIAPSMGTNIVNNGGDVYQHYYVATSVGSIEIKDAASRKFVNFVLNSASNAVIDDDDRFLYAKPHAGSMTVLRFSP